MVPHGQHAYNAAGPLWSRPRVLDLRARGISRCRLRGQVRSTANDLFANGADFVTAGSWIRRCDPEMVSGTLMVCAWTGFLDEGPASGFKSESVAADATWREKWSINRLPKTDLSTGAA